MAEWSHYCNYTRGNVLIPAGEMCDRCGMEPPESARPTTEARAPLPAEAALPLFASRVGQRKWESLQGDGYRMQRIHFARSIDGQERRGSIDPWGKVLWESASSSEGKGVGNGE